MACNTLGMTSKRQQQEAAGMWLRRARERRGLATSAALAQRMGVSPSLISRYETGLSAVSDERAEQIAEALGMDLMEVRQGLGLWVPPPSDGRTDEEMLDEMERTLLRIEKAIEARADDRERPLGEAAISVLRAILEQSTTHGPDA